MLSTFTVIKVCNVAFEKKHTVAMGLHQKEVSKILDSMEEIVNFTSQQLETKIVIHLTL